MSDKQQKSGQKPTDPALRKRAEEQARTMEPNSMSAQTPEAIQQMLHELRVYQIELELQNEELRTAQAEIEAGRARYFDLYDLAPVGYCTLSKQGLIVEANLTAATLLCTSRGALIKQPISRFILKEDQDIYYLHRKKLFETGQSQKCELRLVKPDGTSFWAHLTATAAQAEDGAPVCRVAISDISEHKLLKSFIKNEEENLRNIADAMQESLSVISLNGTFLYANHKATWNMLGEKSGDIIGKNIRELTSEVQAEALIERYQTVYQSRKPFRQEIKVGLKKGDAWFFNTLKPIEYGSPPVPAVLSVSLDITEHKMTVEALRESEERFKALHNASFGGITIHDQGVILECNQGLSEISGFSHDELVGMDLLLLISEQSRETVMNNIRSGREKPYEAIGVRKNGEEYPVRLEARNIPYKGKVVRVVEFRDITEAKQAEEAVIQSNYLLQTIINTAPVRIFYKDRDLRYMGCNNAFAKDAGVADPEDLVGKDDYQLAWKEQAGLYRADDLRVLESGIPKLSYDEPQTTPAGEQIWLRTSKVPLLNDANKIIGVLGMYEDITDRKKAETDKTRLLLRQRAILDNLPMMAWLKDTESRLEMINKPYALACGHTIDDCIGKTDLELFPEEMAIGFMADDFEVCRSGQKKQTEEKIISPEGMIKWHLTFKTPIYDENGLVIGTTGISQDISERKQAEEEREELQAQLQQAQKMEAIGTLAGGIAHDFNNILGAILGYAEMAQEDSPAGSILRQDIDQIVNASLRAKELVKQILAFSRQAETERIPLKPALIIQETLKLLRSSLPSTIAIQQDIDQEAGPILIDPTQIYQVMANLCTNAFHAMEESGGTLSITLKSRELTGEDLANEPHVQPGPFVQLSIGDTGSGIAPEIREKIFQPYFTTKEVGKGTGMGLAIIHGIVKSCKGFVSWHSVLGHGTVIHVFLPVITDPALLEIEPAPLDLSQLGNKRILFVDDEEILAEMGKVMLERLGYHVTVRRNSLEALDTFQKQPDQFDLIITDQTMPGMTGIDMARRMLQIRPGLPIILCTGYSNLISEGQARLLGIKGFAMKPLAKKDIAKLIREVLTGEGSAMEED